nr:MAG TPA: hypothetical protein [Caudoviricetes sp.]
MDFSICHFDSKSICQTLIHIIVRQFRFIAFIDDFEINIHGSAIELLRCIFNGNSCFIRWTTAKTLAHQITFQNALHGCLVFVLPCHAVCQRLPGGILDFFGRVGLALLGNALLAQAIVFDAVTINLIHAKQSFGAICLCNASEQQ